MAEHIEKEAAIKEIIEKDWLEKYYHGQCTIREIIESIPAADVRPVVHGHWVYEEPNGANSFKGAYWCDQCHQPESYRKNFCPNCGADMSEATSAQHVHTDECREKKITYVDTSEDLIKSLRTCGKSLEAAAFPEWDICLYTRAANAIEERERLIDAQLSIIKQYQEYLKKEWIPVTERLPEPFENILVANKRGKHYDIDKGWWNGTFFDRCAKGGYHNVTHWMSLPEPPKEET